MRDGIHVGLSVDALTPELTGVGRYCWELASGIAHAPGIGKLSFWRGRDRLRDPALLLDPATARLGKHWNIKARRIAQRLGVLRPQHAGIDIFHGPNFMLPPWVERGVITVHDLSVFRHPETHPEARVAIYERDFESSLARHAHIITPSNTVREEVIAFTGVDAARVTAVHMGVAGHLHAVPAEVRNPTLQRLGLPTSGYGLTISALEPRKRIDRLLEAWRALPLALRSRFPLVIAGAAGWSNQALQAAIQQGAREGWVIPLGFVAEADLAALYSGAALFVYPSLYEGFGLPPVEAMACGVPVVVANASCLPEVTAGAAMLVDPDDVPGFAAGLQRGLEDAAWRQGAIEKGLAVAAGYSWERCLTRTAEVYRATLAG